MRICGCCIRCLKHCLCDEYCEDIYDPVPDDTTCDGCERVV